MLGNSISYALKQEESIKVDKIKKLLSSQASEFLPSYYAVLYYGKSFLGNLLDPEEYRKRWDRGQIRSTHNFISKQLKKCFGDIPQFWFINRHNPKRNPSEYSFELNDLYDPRAHSEYTPLPTKTPRSKQISYQTK